MPIHIPFPDIKQFKEAIYHVKNHARYVGKDANGDLIYDPLKPLPVLEYEGTVKLHGTNAAICFDRTTNQYWFQSRENIITPQNDNMGFARIYENSLVQVPNLPIGDKICIFGEWCGQGIQKGVGISSLPKMFMVFGVKIDDKWANKDIIKLVGNKELKIYNIYDYPTFNITIDFANPELAQNKLVEFTQEVEKQCPVAKAFGVEGIGEGIVWKCVTPEWENPDFWFKVKGEKHSVSKVKKLASVDVELVTSQKEFISNVVTNARCEQSISKLKESNKPLSRESLGDFIRWIYNDIIKEDSETAKANGFDLTKMGGMIAQSAKTWFFEHENKFE